MIDPLEVISSAILQVKSGELTEVTSSDLKAVCLQAPGEANGEALLKMLMDSEDYTESMKVLLDLYNAYLVYNLEKMPDHQCKIIDLLAKVATSINFSLSDEAIKEITLIANNGENQPVLLKNAIAIAERLSETSYSPAFTLRLLKCPESIRLPADAIFKIFANKGDWTFTISSEKNDKRNYKVQSMKSKCIIRHFRGEITICETPNSEYYDFIMVRVTESPLVKGNYFTINYNSITVKEVSRTEVKIEVEIGFNGPVEYIITNKKTIGSSIESNIIMDDIQSKQLEIEFLQDHWFIRNKNPNIDLKKALHLCGESLVNSVELPIKKYMRVYINEYTFEMTYEREETPFRK